jgi:hypothetical protein
MVVPANDGRLRPASPDFPGWSPAGNPRHYRHLRISWDGLRPVITIDNAVNGDGHAIVDLFSHIRKARAAYVDCSHREVDGAVGADVEVYAGLTTDVEPESASDAAALALFKLGSHVRMFLHGF